MSSNVKDVLDAPIIRLDSVDSTNNYAAGLIDADKAYHGLTVLANCQTQGKGQRGNVWKDLPGESVLMSVVLEPSRPVDRQFELSALVAAAVAEVLRDILSYSDIFIKYPNDIIINDKKAAGILIENVLRGALWTQCYSGYRYQCVPKILSSRIA
ncbi:MAG: biotin--[acetyl-CoA-carboxylase] ligase [Chitinophagaceae bacterium]